MCINLRYHVENVWINEFPSNKVSGMTHTQCTLHRIDASKMFQWKLMKEEKAINLYNMQIAFVCSFDSWFFGEWISCFPLLFRCVYWIMLRYNDNLIGEYGETFCISTLILWLQLRCLANGWPFVYFC